MKLLKGEAFVCEREHNQELGFSQQQLHSMNSSGTEFRVWRRQRIQGVMKVFPTHFLPATNSHQDWSQQSEEVKHTYGSVLSRSWVKCC